MNQYYIVCLHKILGERGSDEDEWPDFLFSAGYIILEQNSPANLFSIWQFTCILAIGRLLFQALLYEVQEACLRTFIPLFLQCMLHH